MNLMTEVTNAETRDQLWELIGFADDVVNRWERGNLAESVNDLRCQLETMNVHEWDTESES